MQSRLLAWGCCLPLLAWGGGVPHPFIDAQCIQPESIEPECICWDELEQAQLIQVIKKAPREGRL